MLYTFGWLFCVLCGAHGYPFLPVPVTLIVVLGQLLFLRWKNRQVYTNDLVTLIFGVVLGFIMEVFFLSLQLIQYTTVNIVFSLFPPAWIWCLYFLFSLTYNHSLKFLNSKWFFPFLFGSIGGPLSYFAGSRLGAVTFTSDESIIILSLFWGCYLSLMVWINGRINQSIKYFFDPNHLKKPLTVYFDVVCPMCNKELQHLKTRKQTGKVIYFEARSPEQFEQEVEGIDFVDAMKEIHAIDSEGKIYKGVDAFSELYCRTDFHFLAVLLSAPISRTIFKVLYKIWAKYRLNNRCKIQPINRSS